MKTYKHLYEELYSYENLEYAYQRARKGRTQKSYVLEFEKNIKKNLLELQRDLQFHSYRPKPLVSFLIKDPKVRIISKSHFRDRIVHHGICRIIEPLFEKSFIYDSYANRLGKGTSKALERFECFKRKVSKNNTLSSYVLKADIKKYFETMNQEILLSLVKTKIKDEKVLFLIKTILKNYSTGPGKGMPLGNLSSQFFANVYLHELDLFVKHTLKVKYYLRYVDDFIILKNDPRTLEKYKLQIQAFLKEKLSLTLHPEKSKILYLKQGIPILGFRIFPHHKLLRRGNMQRRIKELKKQKELYKESFISYDEIYNSFQGWNVFARQANTFKIRSKLHQQFEKDYPKEVATVEVNRLLNRKHSH